MDNLYITATGYTKVTDCCCCSVIKLCLALWDSIDYSTPGSSVLHCLPEFARIHAHWVCDAIQPSYPLNIIPFLCPSIFLSIRGFSYELALCIRWPSALATIFPMNIQDWFPLESVWSPCSPRTLKSLLQCHNLTASILWRLAFFMVQLSILVANKGGRQSCPSEVSMDSGVG